MVEVEMAESTGNTSNNAENDNFLLSLSNLVNIEEEREKDGEDSDIGHVQDNYNADTAPSQFTSASPYCSRKPVWWKQRSGRKATKAQRRAASACHNYRLERPTYGEFLDWQKVFGGSRSNRIDDKDSTSESATEEECEVWFEIGFGTGDNLLCLAQQYAERSRGRRVRLVGAEVHPAGLGKIFQRIQRGVQRRAYWTGYTRYRSELERDSSSMEECTVNEEGDWSYSVPWVAVDDDQSSFLYSNLRIYAGDGIKLLPYIPDNSMTRILVTFPDPFFKEHQKQYRLIQVDTVKELFRVLKPDRGRLFLATDHEGYHHWCNDIIHQFNDLQRTSINQNRASPEAPLFLFQPLLDPCPDRQSWLPCISKYERKGWEEGRITHLTCWQKSKSSLSEGTARGSAGPVQT